MQQFVEEDHYESAADMRGNMSKKAMTDPVAFERANCIRARTSDR